LPFLIHGLYDFSLSEELLKTNDNLAFIGLSLAVLDVVLIILMIRFFLISRKKERCTNQLIEKTIEVNL
ncbi:MAG: hypothetical protein IKH23_00905, partial [Clostridiales bacterium]|nr:hypothetical protein [Clostridiales bacterium]